jgi:uncharacterized protein
MLRTAEIDKYIYEVIVPRYAEFDAAHREDHALTVIEQAMSILDGMPACMEPVDRAVLKMAAACHDLGLVNGRDNHHMDSGKIIRADEDLLQWFSPEEIEIIAQAAEDHRASGKSEPRSIYGKIVAEADRVIDTDTIIRRTIQFGHKHYPDLSPAEHLERAVSHLKEKYGRGGYLKLWISWSDNSARLNALQDLIADEPALRSKVAEFLA